MSKISKEYVNQLTHLHATSAFGSGSRNAKIPKFVQSIIDDTSSLLDFGSGKGYFSAAIKDQYPDIKLHTYDPVTSPIELPKKVDTIYSSDVLEHVEAAHIDETLDDLFNIATKYQYHLIACHPAKKKLNDGRNAHLIIETPDWWKAKLAKYNWEFVSEEVTDKVKNIRGNDLRVIKYIVLLKNGNR